MAEYESNPDDLERVRLWLVSQGLAQPRPGDPVPGQGGPPSPPQQQAAPAQQQPGWPAGIERRPVDLTPPAVQPLPKRANPMDMAPEVAGVSQAAQRHAWAVGKVQEARDADLAPARAFQAQATADNERAALANANVRQQAQQDYQDRLELYRNKVKREAENANPDNYFQKIGVWGNIMLGVAMAASGYMNPRGPNQAVAMIEKNIDRYIMDQDRKRAGRREALEIEGQTINDQGKAGEDSYKTAEEKRAIIWELANNKLKQMANSTSSEAAKASILEAQYAAEQKAAEATLNAFEKGLDNQAKIRVAQIGAGPEYSRIAFEERKHSKDLEYKYNKAQIELGTNTAKNAVDATNAESRRIAAEKAGTGGAQAMMPVKANGQIIGATPAKDFQKVMHVVDTQRELDDIMDQIIQKSGYTSSWDRRPDVANLGSKETHEIDMLYATLTEKIAHGFGFGANLTASELSLIGRSIGTGADTWTTKDLVDRLRAYRALRSKHYDGYISDHVWKDGERPGSGGDLGNSAAPSAPSRPDDEDIPGMEDN